MKRLYFFLLALVTFNVSAQNLPKDFFDGMDMINSNPQVAKKKFFATIAHDSLFHGSYHFLGVISFNENKPDSAIYYFKKSIELNTENKGHTKEMTYHRLLNTYAYQHDFRNAFDVAWLAYKLYPDNNYIASGLEDICLWSYYIKHAGLEASCLSPVVKDEYVVNSINQEYLIVRKLRINDEPLRVTGQALVFKNNAPYDVLTCETVSSKEIKKVNFKLNWDMNKEFGGKAMPTAEVISNTNNPIYERLGAILVANEKADLKTEIKKLMP